MDGIDKSKWEEYEGDSIPKTPYLFNGTHYYIPKKEKTFDEILLNYIKQNGVYFKDLGIVDIKIISIFKMLAVADYLNEGREVKTDWKELYIKDGKVGQTSVGGLRFSFIAFHPDVVDKARELLTDEVIKTAIG